jgi:hypothetical protein
LQGRSTASFKRLWSEIMLKPRWISLLVGALLVSCEGIEGQNRPESVREQILFFTNANEGQRVTAVVGQRIEISLATIGPGSYGDPFVSSAAIRFRNVAWPKSQTPGGPTQIYIFQGAAEGEAEIRIPHSGRGSFSVTVQVGSNAGNSKQAQMTPDQANDAKWKGAWTNLVNDVRQTFRPTMPKLTAVELNLAVANPGPEEEEVTLRVLNVVGEVIATVSRSVPVSAGSHTLFVFPEGGLAVTPGEVHSIRVSGEHLFGWKYVVGGYENGEASFNGRPLLPDARSTFLFTTFGAR